MLRNLIFGIFFITSFGFSQNFQITYQRSSHGKMIENQDPILVFASSDKVWITSQKMMQGVAKVPFEQIYVQPTKQSYVQVATLKHGKQVAMFDEEAIAKQNFEWTNETKKILGYECKKAKTIINSNTLELWVTNEAKIKAAPTVLGQSLGLVLEMVRNGNFAITATKVEKIKEFPKNGEVPNVSKTSIIDYRDALWKSRFTTISVFDKETIHFSDAAKSNDSILRFANGTVILRKVSLPKIEPGNTIFVELQQISTGDAYDRTGSVFMIPQGKPISFLDGMQKGMNQLPVYENGNGKKYQGVVATETYKPLVELMRFFTPFGIKQYNYLELKDKQWHEKVSFRQEISELHPALNNQEVWIGAFIGNYDKGGYQISLEITIHDGEGATIPSNQVIPLFNTTNVMEMGGQEYGTMFNHNKGLELTFTLEKPLKNARLRYITTGHGGWGAGDEFVPKTNTIYWNEQKVHAFTPWRMDCGSYRLYNPASGNFGNGLSSSDYSRSNWCPGTVTNPIFIELGDLPAGNHRVQVKIPQGAPEGSSFSSWNVSGVLIGE
ncbi:MAG: GLPGLI family protein [Flavobacteriales bacterium]|nr:GLPGLI family protein [Flavobacteriales bacterium]